MQTVVRLHLNRHRGPVGRRGVLLCSHPHGPFSACDNLTIGSRRLLQNRTVFSTTQKSICASTSYYQTTCVLTSFSSPDWHSECTTNVVEEIKIGGFKRPIDRNDPSDSRQTPVKTPVPEPPQEPPASTEAGGSFVFLDSSPLFRRAGCIFSDGYATWKEVSSYRFPRPSEFACMNLAALDDLVCATPLETQRGSFNVLHTPPHARHPGCHAPGLGVQTP